MQTPVLLRPPTDPRVSRTLALAALSSWSGTAADLQTLLHAVEAARELASLDEVPAISRAAAALSRCTLAKPHSMGLRGGDLDDLRRALAMVERRRSAG